MDSRELIKKVEWKDLKSLSKKEMLIENNISLPWLFTSLFFGLQRILLGCDSVFQILFPYRFKTGSQRVSQRTGNREIPYMAVNVFK
jgi:hypothetical protein